MSFPFLLCLLGDHDPRLDQGVLPNISGCVASHSHLELPAYRPPPSLTFLFWSGFRLTSLYIRPIEYPSPAPSIQPSNAQPPIKQQIVTSLYFGSVILLFFLHPPFSFCCWRASSITEASSIIRKGDAQQQQHRYQNQGR